MFALLSISSIGVPSLILAVITKFNSLPSKPFKSLRSTLTVTFCPSFTTLKSVSLPFTCTFASTKSKRLSNVSEIVICLYPATDLGITDFTL